jgi:hypothetical protein
MAAKTKANNGVFMNSVNDVGPLAEQTQLPKWFGAVIRQLG